MALTHTMSVTVSHPTITVEFYGEYGKLASVNQGSGITQSTHMDDDVISVNTSRSMGQDVPTFQMQLVWRNKWFENLASNDLVIIKMQRPPATEEIVMYGLVDDIRRSLDWSSGQPQRTVQVTGRGFNKSLVNFDVGTVEIYKSSGQMSGGFFKNFQNIVRKSSAEVIELTYKAFMGQGLSYKFANGKTLDSMSLYVPTKNLLEHAGDDTAWSNYNGSLWNFIKKVSNAPFNETFWEINNSTQKAELIHRPTPFDEKDWKALKEFKIEDDCLVSNNTGRSDLETYTLFQVNTSFVKQEQKNNNPPLWYKPFYEKYGLKQLEVNSPYQLDRQSTKDGLTTKTDTKMSNGKEDVTSTAAYWYMERLFNWNILNNVFLNGTLIVKGDGKYRIGTRVYVESEDMEYYIESVSQKFNCYGSWTTSLGVTRGIKPSKRFAPPWGQFAKFKAEDMTSIVNGGKGANGSSGSGVNGVKYSWTGNQNIVNEAKKELNKKYDVSSRGAESVMNWANAANVHTVKGKTVEELLASGRADSRYDAFNSTDGITDSQGRKFSDVAQAGDIVLWGVTKVGGAIITDDSYLSYVNNGICIPDGVNVQGCVLQVKQGLVDIAKWWKDNTDRIKVHKDIYITAGLNGTHADGTYSHGNGWKLDIAADDLKDKSFRDEFKGYLESLGIIVLDEYETKSDNWTGAHLDLSFKNYKGNAFISNSKEDVVGVFDKLGGSGIQSGNGTVETCQLFVKEWKTGVNNGVLTLFPKGVIHLGERKKIGSSGWAKGKFAWPVPGYYDISTPFGEKKDANGNVKLHTGIDIPATLNADVVAVMEGEVVSNDQLKNFSVNLTDAAGTIYMYFKGIGFSDEGISGVLGVWDCESNIDPTLMEGGYMDSFKALIPQTTTNEGLNMYTKKLLNYYATYCPHLGIDEDGYIFDGNYYPGIGLAQWTGIRSKRLFDFAKEKGSTWQDVNVQIEYLDGELTKYYSEVKTKLENCSTPEEAAYIFAVEFEGFSTKAPQFPSEIEKRKARARAFYEEIQSSKVVVSDDDKAKELQELDKLIVVKHSNSTFTTYGRLENTNVKIGDKVVTNQKIGSVGKSQENNYYCHFGVFDNGKYVDPTDYFSNDARKPAPKSVKTEVYQALTQECGFNKAAACAIMGNIEQLSNGWDTQAIGQRGTKYGLCGWGEDKQKELFEYLDNNSFDRKSVQGQIEFLNKDLQNYENLLNTLNNCADNKQAVYNAAQQFCKDYVKPTNYLIQYNIMGRGAQALYETM